MAINLDLEAFSPIKVTRIERRPSKSFGDYKMLQAVGENFAELASNADKATLEALYAILSSPSKLRKTLNEIEDWYQDFQGGVEITYTPKSAEEIKDLPLDFALALAKKLGSGVMYFYIAEAIEEDKAILENEQLLDIYTKKFVKEITKEISPYYEDYQPDLSIFDVWYSGARAAKSLSAQHETTVRRLGKVVQRLEDFLKQYK